MKLNEIAKWDFLSRNQRNICVSVFEDVTFCSSVSIPDYSLPSIIIYQLNSISIFKTFSFTHLLYCCWGSVGPGGASSPIPDTLVSGYLWLASVHWPTCSPAPSHYKKEQSGVINMFYIMLVSIWLSDWSYLLCIKVLGSHSIHILVTQGLSQLLHDFVHLNSLSVRTNSSILYTYIIVGVESLDILDMFLMKKLKWMMNLIYLTFLL